MEFPKVAAGKTTPAGGKTTPAGGKTTPAGGKTTPAGGKRTPAGRDCGKRTTPDCRVVSAVSVPSSEYCILHACVTVTLLHYCSIRSYDCMHP